MDCDWKRSFKNLIFLFLTSGFFIIGSVAFGDVPVLNLREMLMEGDRIKIIVQGKEQFNQDILIPFDEVIHVPLAGLVSTKGKTASLLSAELAEKLKPALGDVLVEVVIVDVNPIKMGKVTILGEVQKPGVYPWVSCRTLLEALRMAEWFTPSARTDKIQITNPDGKVNTVDFNLDSLSGAKTVELSLQPGDTILVLRKKKRINPLVVLQWLGSIALLKTLFD